MLEAEIDQDSSSYCCICGFMVPADQLPQMVTVDGIAETPERIGGIYLTICSECWKKIKFYTEGGLRSARERTKELRNEVRDL